MARTELGKTVAFDNIAVGQAVTSQERTISGSAPPAKLHGGGEGASGANAKGVSLPAVGGAWPGATANVADNISAGNTTPKTDNCKQGG